MKLPQLSPVAFWSFAVALVVAAGLAFYFLPEHAVVTGMISSLFALLLQQHPGSPEEKT